MKALVLCLLSFPVFVSALVLPVPDWAFESGAIHARFEFTDAALEPLPELGDNVNGTTRAEIVVDYPLGTGWVDANDPDELIVRRDGGGAWDLGPGGWISVSVPLWFGSEGGKNFEVEVFVNVVAFEGLLGAPSVSFSEVGGEAVFLGDGLLENDPPFGSWRYRTWGGSIIGETGKSLEILISADPGRSSLVDTVEIFVIPEPRGWAAWMGGGVLGLVLVARRIWNLIIRKKILTEVYRKSTVRL